MITSENAKSAHPTFCKLHDIIKGVDFCLNVFGPTNDVIIKGQGQCKHLKEHVWEDGDAYYCNYKSRGSGRWSRLLL